MKPALNLSLYLVTNRERLKLEIFFNFILESIKGGVTIVQLREKETSAQEIMLIGKKLLLLLKPLRIPLIINDRVDVAHAIGADGVHLGQSDLPPSEARAILGKEAIIGLSVESLSQAKAAAEEDIDYIAASPLFHTTTKSNYSEPWGLNGLKQLCAISPHPVIAIGGIHENNVKEIMACGAKGVAVVSAIFNAPCPKTAALKLINSIK